MGEESGAAIEGGTRGGWTDLRKGGGFDLRGRTGQRKDVRPERDLRASLDDGRRRVGVRVEEDLGRAGGVHPELQSRKGKKFQT